MFMPSVDVVVPVVMILYTQRVSSTLGAGSMRLAAFPAAGVEDVLGIDGDWVPRPLTPDPTR